MKAKANLKLGDTTYQFTVDEKDEMDTLHKIIVLSNPPTYCEVCQNDERDTFKLTTNKDTEGNTYINVKCKCGAKCKLGQYRVGGYFWRHPFEKYVTKSQG